MVKSISSKTGHVPPSRIQKPQQPFAKALDKIVPDNKTEKTANSTQNSTAAAKADEPNSNTTLAEKAHSVVGYLRIGLPKFNNTDNKSDDNKKNDTARVEASGSNKADVKSGTSNDDRAKDKSNNKSDDDKAKDTSDKKSDDKSGVKADQKQDDDKSTAPKSRKEIRAEAKAKMKEMIIAAKERMKEAREAARLKRQELKAAARLEKIELKRAAALEKVQKMEQKFAEKAKKSGKRDVVKEFLEEQQNPNKQLEKSNSSKLVVLPQELLDELAKPIVPAEKKKPPVSNTPNQPTVPAFPTKPPTTQKPANNNGWSQSLFHDINEKYFGGNTPGSGGFGLQFT